MSDYIKDNLHQDGIDRRGVLKCVAWAGTGALCVLQGGVLKSFALSDIMRQRIGDLKGDISFAQISDSDVGFNKAANAEVTAILREAIAKVNVFPTPPSFIVHTGDLTHLLRPVLAGNTVDQSASAELKIDNFSSSPANLTVAVGTMVTWINRDDIPHTVVSSDDPRVFGEIGGF